MKSLAQTITKSNSFQTYLTIKLLVDKSLTEACFQAYAYFRWLDDQVDLNLKTKSQCQAFITHQQNLIQSAYQHSPLATTNPYEQLILSLINVDSDPNSKLASFIYNFFAIIAFDANRKDKPITKKQLTWYTQTLSRAVTDGIEYFICPKPISNSHSGPDHPHHYFAATAAHQTHMLRDYWEDVEQGFINIPKDKNYPRLNNWVYQQTKLARTNFRLGKKYISALPSLKVKLAAFWYCYRFERILDQIEADKYSLRTTYLHHHWRESLGIIRLSFQILAHHFLKI